MLNVISAFLRQQTYVIHFFFHLVEQSHIALLAFFICLSFIHFHLSYAQFSFYGQKLVLTSELQNKEKRNKT